MGKKKKRSGGGEGGGCGGGQGQQEEKPEADAGSGCEGQTKEKAADDKDKDKGSGAGCKDDKAAKDKEKGCGGGGGGKDEKGGKDKDKKAPPPLPVVTAVLKIDMHCDGCARRIRASVRRFPGVEGVAMEVDKGSMTIVGRFDAKKLRDRVAAKTRKKVELVGGKDNKGGGGGGDKQKCADGEAKQEPDNKEEEKKEQDDKCGGGGNAGKGKGGKDNKKPVVPVIVTVVLKIGSAGLHCDGCMHRIRCKLFKIKGVEQVKMDPAKNQVTVTGTMDAKALPEKLRKKLRRPVDVVQPGKGDKDKDKDGCNKDGKQPQQQGDGKQGGDGKQCKEAAEKVLAAELQLWKTAFYDQQAMQATEFLLSDENPNACAVM